MMEIDLPPGIVKNGTDLQAEGRWRDGNLIRFRNGILQPVGGWVDRGVTLASVPRGSMAWTANTGERWAAFGSFDALRVMDIGGTVTDISPADLADGSLSALNPVGYGIGPFGVGKYGTPREESSVVSPATTWCMDSWGENLIAVSSYDQRILEWPLTGLAAPVTNAPTCRAAVVSDERILFALGADGEPRKIQWSDRENNTVWTPATTNESGDYTIQTQGQIVTGIRTNGQVLILGDLDAHTATYIGPPYVYRIDRVGSSCGLLAPNAVAAIKRGVVWLGRNSLYLYSGGAVEEVPCEVFDYVFGDLNTFQISKAYAVANELNSEVWFFFPSADSIECNRYVIWNYADNVWSIGEIDRVTGFDAGVFRVPMMVDASGVVYDHETGFNYGDLMPWAESGPMRAGDQVMTATMLIPDERTQGDVQATFKTRLYPNGYEGVHGPYTMGEPTNVRFTGRQIRMRVDGVRNTGWRVGKQRLDVKPRGMR